MKHRPKRTLLFSVLAVSVVVGAAYWVVRGIPLKGKVARSLESVLSRSLGMKVAFEEAWLHPPGVVTIRDVSVEEDGNPPVTIQVDALRLSGTFWDWEQGFDFSAHGTTVRIGTNVLPRVPQILARLHPEKEGLAWDAIEAFLPIFGQHANGKLSSGFIKNTAGPGEARLLEYQTDLQLNIGTFGIWSRFAGNERSAELVGRLGYGSEDAVALACSFGFGDGKVWIDPFQVGEGPELEANIDVATKTMSISRQDGAVKADLMLDLDRDRVEGLVLFEHWMLGQIDLVSRNQFAIEWGPESAKTGKLHGVLTVPDLVVNLKPADPLELDFDLDPEGIVLNRLVWGQHYQAKGMMDFKTRDMDFVVHMDGVQLDPGNGLETGPAPTGAGSMDGRVIVQGLFPAQRVEGDIVISNGKHPQLGSYDSMNIHFKGRGNRWELYDSTIYKETGSFLLTGHIGMDPDGLYNRFEVHGNEGVIVLGGWDVTGSDEDVIVGGKEIDDRFKVNFKAFLEEASGARDEKDEFGLEYGLSKQDSLMMRLRGEEQLMGVQRKRRF